MYKKTCSRCTRPSYSSAEMGEWGCPSCGLDLTSAPLYNSSTINPKRIIPLSKKLEAYQKQADKRLY